MNKTIKIIATLLIAVLLVAMASQVALATSYSEIITKVDNQAKTEDVDTSKINSIAAKVIKVIRNVAAVAAVVIVTILGIKYMMGSTQEKADYKKSFIPLIVGIIVVVAAAQIAVTLFAIA